ERYLDHFLAKEEIIGLVLREDLGVGGVPLATLAQSLGQRERQPLDDILRQSTEAGHVVEANVIECATAITGILNMFILAHVFGGAEIHRDTPLSQVRFYLAGLAARS